MDMEQTGPYNYRQTCLCHLKGANLMRRWILPIILAFAFLITAGWGYSQYRLNQEYSTHMENIYQKSFYELVGNVGNVENKLAKLMVSGDRSQHTVLLSEVCRQANAARDELGQLPISHVALAGTSKFLNQLADYSFYLYQKVSEGKTINLEEIRNLKSLHDNAAKLHGELSRLNEEIAAGQIGWNSMLANRDADFYEASDDIYTTEFVNIQNTIMDYPTLIYDGPFSETLDQADGDILKEPEVTEQQARDAALKMIGSDRAVKVETSYNSENGILDTWGFQVWVREDEENPIYISVSKKGGRVVHMLGQHQSESPELSVEEAVEKAERFLEDNGYTNMTPTYQQTHQGVATINFARVQDDIIIYPDLVKVKIALDDGEIYGLEARNYLLAHKQRKFDEPELTMEEAKQLVNPALNITSSRLAVIPTKGKQERLCYEFKGELDRKRFIVYIDANTGQEADILQIIDTENGTLTM
jgi:spore germination protein